MAKKKMTKDPLDIAKQWANGADIPDNILDVPMYCSMNENGTACILPATPQQLVGTPKREGVFIIQDINAGRSMIATLSSLVQQSEFFKAPLNPLSKAILKIGLDKTLNLKEKPKTRSGVKMEIIQPAFQPV